MEKLAVFQLDMYFEWVTWAPTLRRPKSLGKPFFVIVTWTWNNGHAVSWNFNIINQSDLTDMYRTLYSERTEGTFFSRTHETFSRRDHMLSHTQFNKLKQTKIS